MKLAQLGAYVRRNPAVLPTMIFIVLLEAAAFLSIVGYSWTANELATYAFYALAAAVALQIVVMLREEKKSSRTDRG